MARPLSHLDNYFFDLIYLFFRSLIFFNSESENYTRLKVRFIVLIFDLGLLSW
jgi:hypothetical protein